MNSNSGNSMGYFWYWFSTKAYFLLVHILAPFNKRARLLSSAQKNALEAIKQIKFKDEDFVIWFHVASLGEYEQGKPIMLALKQAQQNVKIAVSFFSPSGYNAAQNDPIIDAIFYLPFETKKNAKIIVNQIKPRFAIWVKYDFWYEYLNALHQNSIPVFLVSAQFRPNQIFFKKWAYFQRSVLHKFTHIFCQNASSQQLLNQFGLNQNSLSGDNRYDRVKEYASKLEEIPFVKDFLENKPCIILGSSYSIEEDMLQQCLPLNKECKIIIAPHFVDEKHLQEIESKFGDTCIRFKQLSAQTEYSKYNVLLIDRIGLLARLYRYGYLAFVGGGFWENGLHNSLEPCAFGMPIAFGPKLRRFPEAQELVKQKLAKEIKTKQELHNWILHYLNNPQEQQEKSLKCKLFVEENAGASERVMQVLKKHLH